MAEFTVTNCFDDERVFEGNISFIDARAFARPIIKFLKS